MEIVGRGRLAVLAAITCLVAVTACSSQTTTGTGATAASGTTAQPGRSTTQPDRTTASSSGTTARAPGGTVAVKTTFTDEECSRFGQARADLEFASDPAAAEAAAKVFETQGAPAEVQAAAKQLASSQGADAEAATTVQRWVAGVCPSGDPATADTMPPCQGSPPVNSPCQILPP
jgi:hypothetical protein